MVRPHRSALALPSGRTIDAHMLAPTELICDNPLKFFVTNDSCDPRMSRTAPITGIREMVRSSPDWRMRPIKR